MIKIIKIGFTFIFIAGSSVVAIAGGEQHPGSVFSNATNRISNAPSGIDPMLPSAIVAESPLATRELAAQEEMAFWARYMFWSTLATGAGSLLLIGWTLRFTKGTLNEARRQADAAWRAIELSAKGVEVANLATASALETNELQRTGLIAEQRAWVHIEQVVFREKFVWDEKSRELVGTVEVIFSNNGKTIATKVNTRIYLILGGYFTEDSYERLKHRYPDTPHGDTMIPGSVLRRGWQVRLSEGQIEEEEPHSSYDRDTFERWRNGGGIPVGILIRITYRVMHSPALHETGCMVGVYRNGLPVKWGESTPVDGLKIGEDGIDIVT